jgi:hypothetical protein
MAVGFLMVIRIRLGMERSRPLVVADMLIE